MKKFIIPLVALVIAGIGLFFYLQNITKSGTETVKEPEIKTPAVQEQVNVPQVDTAKEEPVNKPEDATSVPPVKEVENKSETVIGKSAGGRNITAYHFGTGDKEILFVGGIHGGYAWNTSLLAYQVMDYFKANPNTIPGGIKVTVVPVLNPDGLGKVVSVTGRFSATDVSSSSEAKVSGRFNADNVDLNRNFDCGWKASGVWQSTTVSGGSAAFSEPESAAIRDYTKGRKLAAVVGWYSAGGGVYSSSCGNGILPETQAITDIYAKASGYTAYKNFESYQVSGDMTDWFAKNNVPAIGVLLSAHDNVELDKNLAGIKALFENYSK